jgi:flagellar M-ring protein FliF
MSDTDIKRFTQLIRDSIGIKDDRGDQLNVINQAFKTNPPIGPVDSVPLWQQPWVVQLAKQVTGAALVLMVAFLVLRPLMKSLTKSSMTVVTTTVESRMSRRTASACRQQPAEPPIKLAPSFEQQVVAARTLVGQDPKRAAQVVKDWVAADG